MSYKIKWNKLQFIYKFKENQIQIIENNLIPWPGPQATRVALM